LTLSAGFHTARVVPSAFLTMSTLPPKPTL
jgi:hypothetical protein